MLENDYFIGLSESMRSNPEEAHKFLEEFASYPEVVASEDLFEQTTRQRENGIFYTDFHLAKVLISEALKTSKNPAGTFFEPCVGGGAFFFAFVDLSMENTSGSEVELENILRRCYIADNDELALRTVRAAAPAYFGAKYGFSLEIPEENIFLGDSLWCVDKSEIRDFRKIFNQPDGFDFVVTNPPYKLIKGDRRQGEKSTNSLMDTLSAIRKADALSFIQGVPNLYKLFVEAIMCKWVSDAGTIGLLIPKSLLSDHQSSGLREHLLDKFELGSIFEIPEGSQYFKGVGQAFTMFVGSKGRTSEAIFYADIPDAITTEIDRSEPISLSLIRKYSQKSALHRIDPKSQRLLSKLSEFATVGECPGVVNLRGEFDLSLDIGFLSDSERELSLIQGANLGFYQVNHSAKYVAASFLNRPKGKWVRKPRIACQQISNMNQSRRMKWSLIQPDHVLGNSCNFIAIESEGLWSIPEDFLYYFLGLLNSSLLNERFRLLSPNNHVSNGEINSLPVGNLDAPEVSKIIELSQKLTEFFDIEIYENLDKVVLEHFSLVQEDEYWKAN